MGEPGSSQRPRKLGRGLAEVAHVFLSASEEKVPELVEQPEFWLIKDKVISVTSGEGVRGKTLLAFAVSVALVSLGRSAALVSPHHQLLRDVIGKIDAAGDGSTGQSMPIRYPSIHQFGQIDEGRSDFETQTEWIELPCREASFVIIDTPPDISLHSQIWKLSNLVIVLTEPVTKKMQSSYAAIKGIVSVNKDSRIGLVVNMVRGHDEAEKCFRKMSSATRSFIKVNLRNYGYIPFAGSLTDVWQTAELLKNLESCGVIKRAVQIAGSILMDESAIARRGKEVTLKPCV